MGLQADPEEQTAKDLATVMFETATMRSGYVVPDTAAFAERVERMLRLSLDIPLDAKVEDEPEDEEDDGADAVDADAEEEVDADEAEEAKDESEDVTKDEL